MLALPTSSEDARHNLPYKTDSSGCHAHGSAWACLPRESHMPTETGGHATRRTVTLRDTWAKIEKKTEKKPEKKAGGKP